MSNQGRVLVIGIDGATWDLAKPWAEQGKLPNLARLMREGVWGELLSTPQYNSAQAWSSFMTGKNPGKHGIFDFFEPVIGSYEIRFVNGSFRQGKSVWRILSEAGKYVGVINVPMTYPAEEVNGFLLAGLDAPGMDERFAYPPGLLDELKKEVGGYILEPGVWTFIRQGKHELAIQQLERTTEARVRAAKYLMKSRPWDFVVIVFTETDRVQHHFWKFMDKTHPNYDPQRAQKLSDAIERIYRKVDWALGELLKLVGQEDTVIVMSDHGFGPSSHRTFFINRWLEAEGFLRYEETGKIRNWEIRKLGNWVKAKQRALLRAANRIVKKTLPRNMKEWMVRTMPKVRNKVDSVLYLSGIDWMRTLAYSRENAPTININLKGREPLGIVEPGKQYDEVCNAIIEKLLALRCPESGTPIVSWVWRREEIYSGECVSKAPDLLIEWSEFRYIQRPSYLAGKNDGFMKVMSGEELEAAETETRPSGIHRPQGIIVFRLGKAETKKLGKWETKKPGQTSSDQSTCPIPQVPNLPVSQYSIYDVAPTILHLLGVAVLEGMDGKILSVFAPHPLSPPLPKVWERGAGGEGEEHAFSPEEAEKVKERLAGLGYIE